MPKNTPRFSNRGSATGQLSFQLRFLGQALAGTDPVVQQFNKQEDNYEEDNHIDVHDFAYARSRFNPIRSCVSGWRDDEEKEQDGENGGGAHIRRGYSEVYL